MAYYNGIPPPVHHLGYGVYFTTNKNIGKMYNGNSVRGLKEYYIATPPTEIINFGSAHTMMNWWIKNGYDPELAMVDRVAATQGLTDTLSSKHDVVWLKGKGLFKLLDGDQVCVYNPDLIYLIDEGLSKPGDIGSKVVRKSDGMIGIFREYRELPPEISQQYHHGEPGFMTVKWKKGGTDYNVYPSQVEFIL
jgi:hypothetical protein